MGIGSKVQGTMWHAGFGVADAFSLNAKASLFARRKGRRSLRDRERLFMKSELLQCINQNDSGAAGVLFSPFARGWHGGSV
jgi:hypothetical protein